MPISANTVWTHRIHRYSFARFTHYFHLFLLRLQLKFCKLYFVFLQIFLDNPYNGIYSIFIFPFHISFHPNFQKIFAGVLNNKKVISLKQFRKISFHLFIHSTLFEQKFEQNAWFNFLCTHYALVYQYYNSKVREAEQFEHRLSWIRSFSYFRTSERTEPCMSSDTFSRSNLANFFCGLGI